MSNRDAREERKEDGDLSQDLDLGRYHFLLSVSEGTNQRNDVVLEYLSQAFRKM